MAYERDNIRELEPYVPGEQPVHPRLIKLNTNENPYPPAPAVLDAVYSATADNLRRYPPPAAPMFRQTAGEAAGLTAEHVIATNGGDELLRLAITAFCESGTPGAPGAGGEAGGIAVESPTYSLYKVLARIHDTPVVQVPLEDDWSLPADFAPRVREAGCRLALVVNPHAPSGRLAPANQLAAVAHQLRGRAVLLIDEAYVDFAHTSAVSLLDPDLGLDNVLILRTLSKGYSLAGLRFGYGLGHPSLIRTLDKVRDSYNTDYLSQIAATAAIGSRDHAAASWARVIAERERLAQTLRQRGYTVPPSQSNFLLATPPAGLEAARVFETLKAAGIFVRYFTEPRLQDKLRITIGTPEQNDALLDELANIEAATASA